jgi:transcriptional regulator GlxA family with amidase domain
MGTRKLQGAFQRHLGTSPMGWLKEQRLLLAHHLIRQGGMSVSQAATASGLNHFGRFAHAFRLRFGVTPRGAAGQSKSGRVR